jgi:transcription elongation factor Elf1
MLSTPIPGRPHAFTMAKPKIPELPKDPQCPQCGSMMWIAQAEPEKPGYEKRTFECPRCHHVESIVAEIKKG